MNAGLIVAIAMALAFAFTNGVHDAANAIATLVATRAASPGQAVVLAAVGNVVGPLLLGTAVASTIAGIVTVPSNEVIPVLGAALTGAVTWNVITWQRGLPSSSGHALLGGLVGPALVVGGEGAVNWGGFDGIHPVGVLGVAAVLTIAPVLGFLAGFIVDRGVRRGLRRATRRLRGPVRAGQWVMSEGLALTHGANDAQKAVGVVALLLVAGGELQHLESPMWVELACGVALTAGTALGGWPIVRTLGRRITLIRPIDALASQAGSTAVLLGASVIGAPVSTTQIVASSVVGVGGGRRRWRHVRWRVVRAMLLAWLVTVPATAAFAVVALLPWEVAHMSAKRWFLPETADLLGLLRLQAAITVEAMEALVAWSGGDPTAAVAVRDCEHRADETKRQLWRALRDAFSPPLDAEDLYTLSADLDEVLNAAKDLTREMELMDMAPDPPIHEMVILLAEAVRHLAGAFDRLAGDGDATELADAAIKGQRRVEHAYRRAMSALLHVADLREVMGRREVYRRLSRIGDLVHTVAERVWYAVVKEA